MKSGILDFGVCVRHILEKLVGMALATRSLAVTDIFG
jgi:hypothetical protein